MPVLHGVDGRRGHAADPPLGERALGGDVHVPRDAVLGAARNRRLARRLRLRVAARRSRRRSTQGSRRHCARRVCLPAASSSCRSRTSATGSASAPTSARRSATSSRSPSAAPRARERSSCTAGSRSPTPRSPRSSSYLLNGGTVGLERRRPGSSRPRAACCTLGAPRVDGTPVRAPFAGWIGVDGGVRRPGAPARLAYSLDTDRTDDVPAAAADRRLSSFRCS